jgi:outer membrane protein insertion porin family
VSNQSKKLHFSPLLGIILTTTTVWVTEKPIRGQNVPLIASSSDQETLGNFYDPVTSQMISDQVPDTEEPYPQVSAIKEAMAAETKAEIAQESPSNTSNQQASLEIRQNISSDPWSDDISDTGEPYTKVSAIEEAIAAETQAETAQESPSNTSNQQASLEIRQNISSDPWSDNISDTGEPYTKVSAIEEAIAAETQAEIAQESPGNTSNQQASLEIRQNISSDPWSDDISDTGEPYTKVSAIEEAIAAETTAKEQIVQANPSEEEQPEISPSEEIEEPEPAETPVVPIPQGVEPTETETTETEPTGEEPRVLVVEVQVEGANQELENLVYNTVQTRPGRTATRSQLQEDVNAIYATGYFANVEVTPADTPLGVRITYSVKVNPVLEEVVVNTVPDIEDQRALPTETVQEIFGQQYGENP